MELSAEIVVQQGKQVVVFGLVVLVIVVPLPFPFPSPFLSPGRDLVAGPSSPSSCDLPPPPSCSSSPRFFVLVIAFRPGIASPFCPWPPDGDENGSVLLSWTGSRGFARMSGKCFWCVLGSISTCLNLFLSGELGAVQGGYNLDILRSEVLNLVDMDQNRIEPALVYNMQ